MAYNPPRAGLVNAGARRNPYAASAAVFDNTRKVSVTNSPYYDKTNPQAVYDRGIREGQQQYERSAVKKFFDFVLSDSTKQLVDNVLTQKAENQLGDLIANSPEIVEGWKQGSEAERAYVSNLNPIAQNLIEKELSTQVSNDYVQQVNAGLLSSQVLTSPNATEEDVAAERSRIMQEASEKTGYSSLKPYFIAQTAGEVSRIQAANEGKIDAIRQQNRAAQGLQKYGQGYASTLYRQSQELQYRRTDPNFTGEMEAQAFQMWSDLIKGDIETAKEAMVATPSKHLASLIGGVETQVEKLIADGDSDAAMILVNDLLELSTAKDIILPNGVSYWAQTDRNGNSGYDLLNNLKSRVRQASEEGNSRSAKVLAETLLNEGMDPEKVRRQVFKEHPGYQAEAISTINGFLGIGQKASKEQYTAYFDLYTNPDLTVEGALRGAAENNLPANLTQKLVDKAMGKSDSTEAEELDTSFRAAYQSEKVNAAVDQLAYELTVDQKSSGAQSLREDLGLIKGGDTFQNIRTALLRTIRVNGYQGVERMQAEQKLVDADGNEISVYEGAVNSLLKEVESLRQVANYKPVVEKPDPNLDPNLRTKTYMQLYAQRKAANISGMELFEPEFIEARIKDGTIQEGMSVDRKVRLLAENLIRTGVELKDADGNLVYPNQGFVKKILRGEIDPFTQDAEPVNATQPLNIRTRGSRRRFYRRPEPTPEPEPNPFAEPPLPMQQFPDGTGGGPDEEQANAAVKMFTDGLAKIAGATLDVVTGAAPASAQVDNQENVNEMAMVWMGRQQLQPGTPPLPQINGNVVVKVIPMEMTSPKHPYFVAIGIAEGTRTPDGGYTKAWFGHTDPGDGNSNRGTVSGGRGPTAGMTPEQVDNYYMNKLTALSLAVAPVLEAYGMKPNAQVWHRALFNYLDLYVQSPVAARDYLGKIPEALKAGSQIEAFAKIRADSYRDPKTGRLYTSFNSYADLLRDQRSRAGAFDYRKRL